MDCRQQMIEGLESPELRERLVKTLIFSRRIERADAEDAIQDAYMHALRTKHPWDGRSALRTWLTRVAINAAKMRGRRRGTIEKHETVLDDAFEISAGISPYDRLLAVERLEVFEDVLLAEMPAKNRRAILFLIADPDAGYKAAGNKIGIGFNTIKSRIMRARRDLRAAL
jgi:RNA polymerase sigma-70 factor, ECF subfamily